MRPKIELPVAEMVARYSAGDGARVIGRAYGVAASTVTRRLVASGVKMRGFGVSGSRNGNHKPGGPLCTDGHGYLCTYDRAGKKRCVHRACWEAYHGPIPKDHDIHHIDDDRQNNCIKNLSCVSHKGHAALHGGNQGSQSMT